MFDPWVNPNEAQHEYGIHPVTQLAPNTYDAIILAVSHDEFKTMGEEKIRALGKEQHVLYDLKYLLTVDEVDLRL